MDVHSPHTTVREALHFSASLRLPTTVSPDTRAAFVEENMRLLELSALASRLVGEFGAADCLSQSQRKLLTIAVELCANASILFMDEPTSGLDARAGASIFRSQDVLLLSDALMSQPRWLCVWFGASRARAAR